MIETISDRTPIAKKDYYCDACEWVREELDHMMPIRFTFSEYRQIVAARRNGWRIKKGEQYICQFNKDAGDKWTYRAIPAMDALCQKYDLFPER